MSTAARSYSEGSSHWYLPDGTPFYEVPYADARKGMRPATLADARKVGALPGVSTILQTLNKPGLNAWITEQSVLAVLSSPRLADEPLDVFVHRVLNVERVQDQEARLARDKGTAIHDAIQRSIKGEPYEFALYGPYVEPVMKWIAENGRVGWSEQVLIGDGYAGRADALIESTQKFLLLTDFKTCTRLPTSDSWPEHRMQTAAYAACLGNTDDIPVLTANVYISTKEPGQIKAFTQFNWEETYTCAFKPLLRIWQWINNYY